jgi:hypothetical protein
VEPHARGAAAQQRLHAVALGQAGEAGQHALRVVLRLLETKDLRPTGGFPEL